MSFRERFSAVILILILSIPASKACEILEILPNPYGDDSREYVKVNCSEPCVLTDFESSFNLTPGTGYIANNATAFYRHYGFMPDHEGIRLSNRGEEVVLICRNRNVSFSWKEMFRDSGVIYFQTDRGWDFRYEDWSTFKPVREKVRGRMIITPASYRLAGDGYVASYTVTKDVFQGNLTFAVDADPVGGIPAEEILLSRKYQVYFLEGPYRNFHYKYAVLSNDRVVITTENWKWDNRGIIVEFTGSKSADLLRELFQYDLKFRSQPSGVSDLKGDYREGKGRWVEFEGSVTLHIMPDSNPIFDFIENSEGFLYISAPYMSFEWFTPDSPLLNAILNASKRGVDVRVMLNDYEKSREVAEFLNTISNVTAKTVRSPEFDELHGKYMVTEGRVLVTSANLNKYGLKLNREIALIIESKKAERFMKDVFERDWERRVEIYPAISLSLLGVALLLGFYFLKRFK